MTDNLTPKEALFVKEYLVDLNATDAARRAGYSAKTAGVIAHELLGKPRVATAIQEAQKARSARLDITADMVLQEMAKLAFSNMQDYGDVLKDADLHGLERPLAAAVSEMTVDTMKEGRGEEAQDVRRVRLKLYDKGAALVNVAKAIGMKGFTNLIGEDPEHPFQRAEDDATKAARIAAILANGMARMPKAT